MQVQEHFFLNLWNFLNILISQFSGFNRKPTLSHCFDNKDTVGYCPDGQQGFPTPNVTHLVLSFPAYLLK